MMNLSKKEIVDKIYAGMDRCKTGAIMQRDVKDIVQRTLDILRESLSSGRNIELRNFGILEVQVRKPRVGRNPTKPSNEVVIPKRAVVKFKAGKELKAALKVLDLKIVEEGRARRARRKS